MKIGIIGLGRMGSSIAHRLVKAGHKVVGFDVSIENARMAREQGIEIVAHAPVVALEARIIWLLLPAGKIVDDVVQELLPNLRPGDIIIDAGNSHYTDSVRRAQLLIKDEIAFIDCGTSGGLQGRELGFCLMIGGERASFERIEDLCKAVAAPQGYAHVGPSGAGHYVKMIHNGIEYALLQAYAEGFQLLKEGNYEQLDLAQISALWNHGAVIRSWLLALTSEIMHHDQELREISGRLDQSGTGTWTVEEAHAQKVPVPCIEKAVAVRSWSQESGGNYATKLIALLRNKFGGHAVHKVEK